ncbi:hypothetical protein NM688_g8636 [Phlebia brevispora]|uniref:Uncharacterized protein n=1 Tax=Phlebia brevispora TaxID=194682 RepID=A0ACC1RRH9_9APHY|nr:hypothetical protein NM688_g8636 [Phlebia brevispora]
MERVVRLSGLCCGFELGDRDSVEMPSDAPLAQSSARTLPAASVQPESNHALPRRAFRLEEAIPLLFGLVTKKIVILGTQTWDEDAKATLYESVTDAGVQVWKLRRFEEVEVAGTKTTRITETIKGKAPALLRPIVQKETARSHK